MTGEVKALKFAFLFKEISVTVSGYIAAPCLFYSSLSTDKFISGKSHEHKCPVFRRLSSPVHGSQGSNGALETDFC